ncbi:TPA: helix-turn-helix domain-containing protein [Clostridioides difficile]|nr:helix-turn-helix domain-containing protein [Clostridioides difficile]
MRRLGNVSSFKNQDNVKVLSENFSSGIQNYIESTLNAFKSKAMSAIEESSKIELLEPKQMVVLINKSYPDKLLSVAQTAERLATSKNFIYKLIEKNLIKSMDMGSAKISSYEIDDFIARNQGKDIGALLKEMERSREGVI